ncbi:MAG: diguanylate cyclase [Campylobacterales bacterium]|nr:diguanylate cyclase [Campylobacterales bacterium]
MRGSWPKSQITLLLYLIVFLIPVGFFTVSKSFDTVYKDAQMMQKAAWLKEIVPLFFESKDLETSDIVIQKIDQTLQEISLWISKNGKYSALGENRQVLEEDFLDASACWNIYKQDRSKHNLLLCKEKFIHFAAFLEDRILAEQRQLANLFYLSLAFLMLFVLFLIYFVRLYMHIQHKKHSIYDHDTMLFNKKYFDSQLALACDQSKRYKTHLSLLLVSVKGFDNKTYSSRSKRNFLQSVGYIFHTSARTSDIVCRYNEKLIGILLPFTSKENASVLTERIKKTLKEYEFGLSPKIEYSFIETEYSPDETAEEFIARSLSLL